MARKITDVELEKRRARGEQGYGCPPKHSRFLAGRSGNPKGRRKASLSFEEVIKRELDMRIKVNENGKTKTMTVRDMLGKRLTRLALTGNLRAILQVVAHDNEMASRISDQASSDEISYEADVQTIRDVFGKLR